MKASIRTKLEKTAERFEEIGGLLADSSIAGGSAEFRNLSMEYARLEPVVASFRDFVDLEGQQQAARTLASDTDPEMRQMGEDEVRRLDVQLAERDTALGLLLLPRDPRDERNIYLEIRAGTGGDEAAIFAGDLHRMYMRYADSRGWQTEVLNANLGEHGGYKEVISRVVGHGAFSVLKFESGAHRVQRVPETEAQGRIHTSACTVAVLPELDEIDDIEINP
ncbi:MAG: peptide chain release factor 1, partial [Pseudomonadota bacterium]